MLVLVRIIQLASLLCMVKRAKFVDPLSSKVNRWYYTLSTCLNLDATSVNCVVRSQD